MDRARYILSFIRFRISFTAIFLAIPGFLLFNPLGLDLIPIVLASFLGFAGVYSYNNMTDRKEDSVNRRKNPLAYSRTGFLIAAVCFSLSILSSLFAPFRSFIFCLVLAATGIIYSFLRIKRFTLVKNLYTAFAVGLAFLLGTGNAPQVLEITVYYLLLSLFLFIGSLVSDIRDYTGDKKAGHRTFPVICGVKKTKHVIYFLQTLFLITVSAFNFRALFIFIPFILFLFVLLNKNRFSLAHFIGGSSFIFLSLTALVLAL